jgi:hypothetical protein
LRVGVAAPRGRSPRPLSLQFRLFEWGWASQSELRFDCGYGDAPFSPRAMEAKDIYRYAQGVSLHYGWGEREFTPDGRLYRLARNGATFSSYRAARMPGRLMLDLQALDDSPCEVRVAAGASLVVERQRLSRGARARVSVPNAGSVGRTGYTLLLDETPGADRGVRVRALRRVGPGQALRSLLRPLARPRVDYLHTNACGDFTLMHREDWFGLRGYPEWEAYSMNIDGFLCFAAHADGLREVVLRDPMRIYHIEHGLGSGWSPEGEKKLYDRITSRGIDWIGKEQVLEHARRMYERGPIVQNGEDWGFGREALQEAGPMPRSAGVAAPAAISSPANED